MSFGPSQAQKNANNTAGGITDQSLANSTNAVNQGNTTLATGGQNVNTGTNFLNSVLNGNAANTASLLAPTIAQNRATNQNTLQSLSTLTPRGGGRSGTLFNAAFAPSAETQSLFNGLRGTAATTLPQIGLAQEGIGTNLLNTGNSSLGIGSNTNANLAQSLQAQQNAQNQLISQAGGGLFSLLTAPLTGGASGGGSSILGTLFPSLCWVAEAVYGRDDMRTHVVRAWLHGPFGKTRNGRIVVNTYRTFGRQVAWLARRSEILRNILRPLFDLAVVKATRISTFVEIG